MKYLLLGYLLFLGACSGPITKENIRLSSAYSTTFSIEQPYQKLFAEILAKSRACYLNTPTKTQLTLVGSRNNADKTANITLEYVYAMAEHDVILMIDFLSEQDNSTKITVFASNKSDKKKADIVRDWLTTSGKSKSCVA